MRKSIDVKKTEDEQRWYDYDIKSFTVEGIGIDIDDMVCEYSAENETLSLWNVTWTNKVNGMDAHFELSGTLKKAA